MRPRFSHALCAGLLGCTRPDLAESATPGPGWPDLADPPAGLKDGVGDSAVIVAIDDPALGGRPGAWEVASGWWRYLVRTRGLSPNRVTLLHDDAATAAAIRESVDRMELESPEGAMLWFVFIGQGESQPDHGGVLTTATGTLPVSNIRSALAFGFHESSFMLLDACAQAPVEGWRSGVPAAPPAPVGASESLLNTVANWQRELVEDAPTQMVDATALRELLAKVAIRRNSFVLTAGLGPHCRTELGGRPWPALAYAVLGGLQGWADMDEDGSVNAFEVAIHAQSVVAELDDVKVDLATVAKLDAAGTNLILADLVRDGPRAATLASRRRRTEPIEPEAASQTDGSLEEARALIELALEDMVPVAPGHFRMGCNRQRDSMCESDERPQHLVELGGFAIDRTEVGWGDYRECVATGACSEPSLDRCWVWTGIDRGFVIGGAIPESMLADDHPVMCVSWREASDYCHAVGKRLPTEAEWERAARGLDRRIHPWGDEAANCSLANGDGCSDFTMPVGSLPAGASPVGALHMAGNVAEWVSDWWHEHTYRYLLQSKPKNPQGPDRGLVRAIRGGSFYGGALDLRASYRYGLEPTARTSIVGFRCAR
jgi:formylglycine-generating enzyme required for sulfatase activity